MGRQPRAVYCSAGDQSLGWKVSTVAGSFRCNSRAAPPKTSAAVETGQGFPHAGPGPSLNTVVRIPKKGLRFSQARKSKCIELSGHVPRFLSHHVSAINGRSQRPRNCGATPRRFLTSESEVRLGSCSKGSRETSNSQCKGFDKMGNQHCRRCNPWPIRRASGSPSAADCAPDQLKPNATAIYVAANQAAPAIEEAIEAEVPLVVAVAEHVPLHDMLRIHSILKTQSKSRLVGPNSPGIISAVGKCRIGFQPLPCFTPGRVAIVAKSGTLSYETVASTTRAGLGQSLCIGVGGDILPGTDFCEALSVLENDPDTDAIALIGEIGGTAEVEAASWIRDYRSRAASPKPIVGLIAGIHEVRGRVMGHAGAFTSLREPDAKAKIAALADAGVILADHPSKIGEVLREQLNAGTSSRQDTRGSVSGISLDGSQCRQMSTALGRPRPGSRVSAAQQQRHLYLSTAQSMELFREATPGSCSRQPGLGTRHLLGIGIDRSARAPCVIAAPSVNNNSPSNIKRFPFDFRRGPDEVQVKQIAGHLGLSNEQSTIDSLGEIIKNLTAIFYGKEAFVLTTQIAEGSGSISVVSTQFAFDDAAFRVGGRHKSLHELRDLAVQDPSELEAEKSGIVYLRLEGDGNIGTLVNGAGLAMNTVDALANLGGQAANFLDTGGKATSETVKKSFEIILRDPRVRVVFVNIFGGLTLGDMVARGIILAFEELSLTVPVVVRIRGTNEREGQNLIAESGLPLYAFDSFSEAAAKAIELSRR